MKFIGRLFLLIIILAVIGLVTSVFMMVEDTPLVAGSQTLSPGDLNRAQVFMENSDPRNLEPGAVSAFTVQENDLELLAGYALDQLEGGGARIDLRAGLADVAISARLPDNPLGQYMNLQLTMSQYGEQLAIERLQVGGLAVPAALADSAMNFAHEQLQAVPEYVAALDAINGYSIDEDRLHLVYQWQPELMRQLSDRGRDLLISQEFQERLLAHATNLSSITNSSSIGDIDSLGKVVSPMFLFAQARGGDAVEENRAAILAMSMYIMGINIPRVLGLPRDAVPPMGRHKFTLSERADFAQHFLVSAGIAAAAGTALSDTIGLLKELEDSDGGTGFSFTDIGADRTGVRVTELALSGPAQAAAVQDMLAYSESESIYMAEFRDLPELMPQETFLSIYGGVGEPAYNRVIDDIENRISATRLFREVSLP